MSPNYIFLLYHPEIHTLEAPPKFPINLRMNKLANAFRKTTNISKRRQDYRKSCSLLYELTYILLKCDIVMSQSLFCLYY